MKKMKGVFCQDGSSFTFYLEDLKDGEKEGTFANGRLLAFMHHSKDVRLVQQKKLYSSLTEEDLKQCFE